MIRVRENQEASSTHDDGKRAWTKSDNAAVIIIGIEALFFTIMGLWMRFHR